MNLFQHKTFNGSIHITSTARFGEPGPNPDFETIAVFSNSELGQAAYEFFKNGLNLGVTGREISLFDEETDTYVVGPFSLITPVEDATPGQMFRVYQMRLTDNGPVPLYACGPARPGSKETQWRVSAASAHQYDADGVEALRNNNPALKLRTEAVR